MGGHKKERLSWPPVLGKPQHYSGGTGIACALQFGGLNCGQTLALADGGGRISRPERTRTCGGPEPVSVIRVL